MSAATSAAGTAVTTGTAGTAGASPLSAAVTTSINTIKATITTELNGKTRKEKAEILKDVLGQLDAGDFIAGLKKEAEFQATKPPGDRAKRIQAYINNATTTNAVFKGGKRKSRKASRKSRKAQRK
jgi:hypothetical protein